MKIVTGLLGLLAILTVVYFAQVWRSIPQVNRGIQAMVPQTRTESVQIIQAGAETPTPTPTPTPSPARKKKH